MNNIAGAKRLPLYYDSRCKPYLTSHRLAYIRQTKNQGTDCFIFREQIFKIPYCDSSISVTVHRVGSTLILDGEYNVTGEAPSLPPNPTAC